MDPPAGFIQIHLYLASSQERVTENITIRQYRGICHIIAESGGWSFVFTPGEIGTHKSSSITNTTITSMHVALVGDKK